MSHAWGCVWRRGRRGGREIALDLLLLMGLGLVLMASGLGLRDPWPADEPRFALVARDMLASGDWLIPRIGGDTYEDKPPLFFWLIAASLWLTQSLRVAFLLPSLLAALGCVALVYDLGRRLWSREAGLAAGLALLAAVQFVWQGRQGQIDATLCFWTTLGLYGLLRHLLLGPAWGWHALGWAAAGFGIITKGVGFLPLLLFVPYVLARGSRWQPRPRLGGGAAWALGPLALLAAVSVWLVPLWLALRADPSLAAYADEIFFEQTVERYTNAWHHLKPFWYFLVNVIPILWLPLTALLPWLVPRWRASLRNGDLRILLPLTWIVMVVAFFSFSSGKRGVYVLPALPALALICGPYLVELAGERSAQRMVFALAGLVAAVAFGAAGYALVDPGIRAHVLERYGLDVVGPLALIGALGALACAVAGPRRGFAAWGATLAATLLVIGYWANPAMDAVRSGAAFARLVESATADVAELGLVGYKEQYLLQLRRPTVNFGHARWREHRAEAADAAAWLAQRPSRMLLADPEAIAACFTTAVTREVAVANRKRWFLVSGPADPHCVARGDARAARAYGGR